jgi:hypothetical protein
MNFSIEIDNLRTQFKKQRFINERDYLKNQDHTIEINEDDEDEEDNWILDRLQGLDKIINNFSPLKKQDSYKSTIDQYSQFIFKKKRHLLPEYHKMEKIEEYINKTIENTDHQKKIINEFKTLIFEKKLNGKKYIIYDESIPEITSIPALNYNKDTGKYTIKIK